MRRVAPIAVALALPAGCGGGGGGDTTTTKTFPKPSSIITRHRPQEAQAKTRPTPTKKAPAAKAVGLGDQAAAYFSQPLFRELGITKARRVVPWDAMSRASERALTDQWLAAARKARVEPLISFSASRVHPTTLPSVAQYRRSFLAFRKRYPSVRVYSPWNEINHKSQPTARHPERAAAYYGVVRANCRGCTIVAADVLDQAGFERYLARFRRAVKGPTPQVWGLHNYSDTNRFRTKGTRAMLRAVKGEIWVTETGGVARFGRAFPFDLKRQARAVSYTFHLLNLSPRIRRLYLYNWTGAPPGARFDSGLTNAGGTPRPAYATLRAKLR